MNKLLLISFLFGLVASVTFVTSDLQTAINNASPGDIIEVKAGVYTSSSFTLKSGIKGKPISIRAVKNAKVIFSGVSDKSIFDGYGLQYINIEGPFELKNAMYGARLHRSEYINISGLTVHDVQQQGILVSGHYNNIFNNTVFNCVLENKSYAKSREYGWGQCVAVWGIDNNNMSTNIVFKNNKIYNGYGEGLDFLECDTCYAIGNEITNSFSMNIYIDSSRNIMVEGNTLRVTSNAYDTKWGSACGVGLSPESNTINIENIVIKNNVIIGTRLGVYFFTFGSGGYNNIKILHNTLWKVSVVPIWFRPATNNPQGNEMINNFFWYDNSIDAISESSWTVYNNYYYNTDTLPSKYPGKNQKYAKTLDINSIFYNKENCNYNDMNMNVECLRPSKNPGILDLYHGGAAPITQVTKDFSGCLRNTNTPSVGAFEYPEKCEDPDASDSIETDIIEDRYDVKFIINYCPSGTEVVKLVGEHCSWNVVNCPTLTDDGSCFWSTTIPKATEKTFAYKFAIINGNSIYRWENDPSRTFNGPTLESIVEKSASGIYEKCSYVKSGTTITLFCNWK